MKKRLRKKLRLSEFRELDFTFFAEIEDNDDKAAALFERFVELLDENEMDCTGGFGGGRIDLCICTGMVDTDNENRREQFLAKVSALEGVSGIRAGELCRG